MLNKGKSYGKETIFLALLGMLAPKLHFVTKLEIKLLKNYPEIMVAFLDLFTMFMFPTYESLVSFRPHTSILSTHSIPDLMPTILSIQSLSL